MKPTLLSFAEICRTVLNVGERTGHELRKNHPDFPKPIALGPRCFRFRVSEVEAWIAAQPVARPQAEPRQLVHSRKGRPRGTALTSGEMLAAALGTDRKD